MLLQSITTKWGRIVSLFTRHCLFPLLSTLVIEVSNDDSLGSNVCINQADTSPSFTALWHFISCPGANNFGVKSSDKGGAEFCLEHDGSPGIGMDFPSGEATVGQLQLECARQIGTTLNVIDITVNFSECFCTRVQ